MRPKTLLRCYFDRKTSDSCTLPGTLIEDLVLDCANALGGLEIARPVSLFGRAERFSEADA